jgi:hypothetical protein
MVFALFDGVMRNYENQFGATDLGLILFVVTGIWLIVTQGLFR